MNCFVKLSNEAAETLALQALTWLSTRDDLLSVFMGATGASADDLRARMGDADFLGSVLDFLLMDDAWIIGFCDAHDLPYEQVGQARAALPGGAETHWT